MARPEQRIYLATRGGAALGFCACIETPSPLGAQIEIDMLGVVPHARRQGLGVALIRHSLEQARQRGIRRFRAVVAADNVASGRAFERAGFVAQQPHVAMLVYVLRGLHTVPFLPKGWRWHLYRDAELSDPAAPSIEALARGAFPSGTSSTMRRAPCASAGSLVVQTLAYQGIWSKFGPTK